MDTTQADIKTLCDERDDLTHKLAHAQETIVDLRQRVATLERNALLLTDQGRLIEQRDLLIEALRRQLSDNTEAATGRRSR